MQKNIYSVFDSKALVYMQPFYAERDEVAARYFAAAANDINTDIGRYNTDYTLFCIGEFDDSIGNIATLSPHRNLGLATSFLKDK
jgi:hypothetical protein